MSDERKLPRPLQAAIAVHQKDLRRLLDDMEHRESAQLQVEDSQKRAEDSANFMAETFPVFVYNPDAEPEAVKCRELEEQHAIKFHGLTAPATEFPARALTLTITHPTIGAAYFVRELTPALKEFADYQAAVEDPHKGAVEENKPRYPFTASNGVVFDVQAHVQLDQPPPPRDPAEPAQLVPATFRPVDFG